MKLKRLMLVFMLLAICSVALTSAVSAANDTSEANKTAYDALEKAKIANETAYNASRDANASKDIAESAANNASAALGSAKAFNTSICVNENSTEDVKTAANNAVLAAIAANETAYFAYLNASKAAEHASNALLNATKALEHAQKAYDDIQTLSSANGGELTGDELKNATNLAKLAEIAAKNAESASKAAQNANSSANKSADAAVKVGASVESINGSLSDLDSAVVANESDDIAANASALSEATTQATANTTEANTTINEEHEFIGKIGDALENLSSANDKLETAVSDPSNDTAIDEADKSADAVGSTDRDEPIVDPEDPSPKPSTPQGPTGPSGGNGGNSYLPGDGGYNGVTVPETTVNPPKKETDNSAKTNTPSVNNPTPKMTVSKVSSKIGFKKGYKLKIAFAVNPKYANKKVKVVIYVKSKNGKYKAIKSFKVKGSAKKLTYKLSKTYKSAPVIKAYVIGGGSKKGVTKLSASVSKK